MPRIRTIKPEFWQDEKLAILDPLTRLVFLGLIGMADDAGRLVDNIKTIDGFVFPETDDSCREAIETLTRLARVLRYRSTSGQKLLQIAHWERHQRVVNPNKYTLPGREPHAIDQAVSLEPNESLNREKIDSRSTTNDLRPTTNDQRPASEGARACLVRISSFLVPEQSDALARLMRASRNPDAMLAEIEAIATGMRNILPVPTWSQVGQALLDLSLNGERPTALLLRTYVGRLTRESRAATNGTSDAGAEDVDEYERLARKFEAEAKGAPSAN